MISLLCGGVGGSKLALGLYSVLPPESLAVIGNTGDDVVVHGLHVSPDLDTVMYTLSSIANPNTGWGIAGDTFEALGMLNRYGAADWFRLGDRDLATHILRTQRLARGETLTSVTHDLTSALDVRARILPMCDARVDTKVRTSDGWLPFQDYFVRRRHEDTPLEVEHQGIAEASISREVIDALRSSDAIIIAPSNPVVSIGPIISVPGMRDALRNVRSKRVAVSPIVGSEAVSGPAGRLLAALGFEVSVEGVADYYRELIDALVIDVQDAERADRLRRTGIDVLVTSTLMTTLDSKQQLAREILRLARS